MESNITFNDLSTRDLNSLKKLLSEISSIEELIMQLDVRGWNNAQKDDVFQSIRSNAVKGISHVLAYRNSDNYTTIDYSTSINSNNWSNSNSLTGMTGAGIALSNCANMIRYDGDQS